MLNRFWSFMGIRLSKGQPRPNNHPLTKVHIPAISESQIQVLTDTIRPPQNTCPCISIQAERKHASTPVERSRHWYLSFVLGGEIAPFFIFEDAVLLPTKQCLGSPFLEGISPGPPAENAHTCGDNKDSPKEKGERGKSPDR